MGFSRQEYWSGLPFPSPGGLPDPGIELASPVSQLPLYCAGSHVCITGRFLETHKYLRVSLVVQRVKRLPTMRETRVRTLGCEDPLEKEMATHASILAWRIPWMEELGGQQVHGVAQSWT